MDCRRKGGRKQKQMKANRKFVESNDAVSPVIAVILMVAITVVLAATVFVLVSDIGSNTSKTQPSVGWADSEVDDSWRVNQAPQQVNWEAYQIKSNTDATNITLNGDDSMQIDVADGYVDVSFGGAMAGGDEIVFCIAGATTPADNVRITLLHTESNSVAHEYNFLTVAGC